MGLDFMELELTTYPVRHVAWGARTAYEDGTLTVDRQELLAAIADPRIAGASLESVVPGEATRIVHVVDAVQPRTKTSGGSIFPGFLGPARTVGTGATVRLDGVVLLLCTEYRELMLDEGPASVNGPRERIVDMSGPAQPWSPFGSTLDLVLTCEPADGIPMPEYDRAIHVASLKAADYLARAAVGARGGIVQRLALPRVKENLPKIVYLKLLQSDGYLRETYLYGEPATHTEPTVVHPNELVDGCLVSMNCSFAGTSTLGHCSSPTVAELVARHGRDLDFCGVVLTPRHPLTDFFKEKRAAMAANLCKILDADGVVESQEGGGNSIVDQMLQIRFLEQLGIRTSVITYEMSGREGRDFPLIYHVPEADLLVSTGNREEPVDLPAMPRVLGGERCLLNGLAAGSAMQVRFSDIAYSFDLSGLWRVRAEAY